MSVGFIDILQSLIDGILFGSIYALIGLGFTLIFGAMEKLNMAYAASSIGGAYVGLGLATLFSLPLFLVFLIGPIAAGLISILVYLVSLVCFCTTVYRFYIRVCFCNPSKQLIIHIGFIWCITECPLTDFR